jgi:thiamine-monophosphate kinase
VSAMIDLSDGLSRDLRQICQQSGVGAVIDAAAVPIHDDAIEMRRDGYSPLEHALHDGEDYELLFTLTSNPETEAVGKSMFFPAMFRIGRITAEPGIFLETNGARTPLEPKGWEHTL